MITPEEEARKYSKEHKYDNVFYEGKFIKDFLHADEFLKKGVNEFLMALY